MAGTSPKTTYVYEDSVTSNVYNVGLRMLDTQYPSVSGAYLRHYYDSPNSASDRLNRLGGLRLHDGGLGAGNRMHHVHYRYSGTGRLATLYSNSSSTFGINVRLDRFSNAGNYDSLDRFGRVVEQKWTRAGGTLDHFTMQHDYAGNLIQRNNVLRNANRSYGYDNLNRLLSSSETGSGASAVHRRYWDLDQLGNWEKLRGGSTASSSVLETRTFNQANELQTNTGGANPVHDETGNMTGIPDPVNSNSLLGGTYDAWNRLVTLGSETYAYDGLNRRIIRQSGQAKHFYYNESWQVLTETDGSGSATAIYSYHPNFVDAVAVRMTPTGEHFFTHDHQYSVTSAVDRASTSVVERYDYSPYGESTVLDANFAVDADGQSDINNEYRYTGRRLDPSGLQLHRNRYYHPQLGQWINRDPLGYVDGMNLYGAYFAPGKMDPLGLLQDISETREAYLREELDLNVIDGLLNPISSWVVMLSDNPSAFVKTTASGNCVDDAPVIDDVAHTLLGDLSGGLHAAVLKVGYSLTWEISLVNTTHETKTVTIEYEDMICTTCTKTYFHHLKFTANYSFLFQATRSTDIGRVVTRLSQSCCCAKE